MKKTCKVIMLPTDKASKLCLADDNKLVLSDKGEDLDYIINRQHLYITSDDEIKKGDWTIDIGCKEPHGRLTTIDNQTELDRYINADNGYNIKKVIASTDPSLGLPLIPESFIQAYVKAEGKIDEVQVEYEEITEGKKPFQNILVEQPKTRDDNTIIIHQAKAYTREEVWCMFNEIAETLTYAEDPEILVQNALDKCRELGDKL